MNEQNIIIKDKEYINITEVTIYKCMNEHGNAIIRGYVGEGMEEQIKRSVITEECLFVSAKDNLDVSDTVFAGIVTEYKEKHTSRYCEVELQLTGNTFTMDLVENNRIFQNTGETYYAVMDEIVSTYQACFDSNCSEMENPIDPMSLQYGETDWAYLKRLASEKNVCLIPKFKRASNYFSVEVSKGMTPYSMKALEYTKSFDLQSYKNKLDHGIEVNQFDEEYYIVKSRSNLELGDKVKIEGNTQELYVYSVNGSYQSFHLESEYVLKPQAAFSVVPIKNYNMVGASISGTVTSVSNDMVTVNIELEGNQSSKKMLDFATVYSSKDNAGWYCMPEIGDSVRVYFPNEDANEAFVMNATQIQKGDKDPTIKFFRNPQGKEIIFAPTYLKITNNDGLSILLDDEKGVMIDSNLPIQMNADGAIHVISKKESITVEAKDSINMEQGNSSVVIGEDISMKASQIHMQQYE